MARQKLVFVRYYDDNKPSGVLMANRGCAVYTSFAKAYNDLAIDIDYWISKGARIIDEWYNDRDTASATSCRVAVQKADGTIVCANIVPSGIY